MTQQLHRRRSGIINLKIGWKLWESDVVEPEEVRREADGALAEIRSSYLIRFESLI
jgi:hypothetical protein